MGVVAQGKAGLGSGITSCRFKEEGKDRQSLLQQGVHAAMEEERASKMVGMRQQGT